MDEYKHEMLIRIASFFIVAIVGLLIIIRLIEMGGNEVIRTVFIAAIIIVLIIAFAPVYVLIRMYFDEKSTKPKIKRG